MVEIDLQQTVFRPRNSAIGGLGGELTRFPVDQMLQLAGRAFDHLEPPSIIVLRLSIVSDSEEVLDHFEGHRTAEKGLLVHAENQNHRRAVQNRRADGDLGPK